MATARRHPHAASTAAPATPAARMVDGVDGGPRPDVDERRHEAVLAAAQRLTRRSEAFAPVEDDFG